MKYITLSNGYKLPNLCFGTDIVNYCISTKGQYKQKIKHIIRAIIGRDDKKYKRDQGIIQCSNKAVEYGCNFFDTSRAYGGSERMLQDALKKNNRNDFFICTKLDNYSQIHDIPARDVLMESMRQLGVDYIDVYLLHWPVEGKYLNYWKQLEQLYKYGLVKAIGVSNCKIHHLEAIKAIAEIMPMINEVELHPLLSEIELRKYCVENNIQIMAYTSTARLDFRLKASKRMRAICDDTGKNLSQIILRWHIQNGVIPIFNTSSINHFKSNVDVYDFQLTDKQMRIIDGMNINSRTRYDSDNCEWDIL